MKAFRIIQFVFAFSILAFSFWIGAVGKMDVMIVSFLSFLLVMFINNLDRISEIRASAKGFEAKTREIVQEAEFTIKELHNLAKILAKTEFSLIMRTGRLGGYSEDEKEAFKKSVLNVLQQLRISKQDQEQMLDEDWNTFIIFDYASGILGGSRAPEGFSHEEISEWQNLRAGGIHNPASPDQLQDFLLKVSCLSDERKELLEDYRYFIKNKKHRRPDVWKENTRWGHLKK